jgi:hypothetical protein
MNQSPPLVSLGFTDEKFPAGTHICQIFSDDKERSDSLLEYLCSGLENGERTTCFSDKVDKETIARILETTDISMEEAIATGDLSLSGTNEVYFEDNKFDPERMLERLAQFEEDSKAAGCSACRAIGEMNPKVLQIEGGSRLLEYESRVSMLLREHPVTTVCQYDATKFDGATIMDVLKVHPMMIVRGSVVRNPFFIPPEQFIEQLEN